MDKHTTEVSESKFNGTATLTVTPSVDNSDKQTAKRVGEQYFKDVHGSDPSNVVAEKDEQLNFDNKDRWTVMGEDSGPSRRSLRLRTPCLRRNHSSGSLADSRQYEI